MSKNVKVIGALVLTFAILLTGCSKGVETPQPSQAPSNVTQGNEETQAVSNEPSSEPSGEPNGLKEDGTPYKVGIIPMSLNDSFQVAFCNAAKRRLEGYGMSAVIQGSTAHNDAEVQLQYIENMIASGYDAILIAPSATAGLTSAIRKCEEAGVVLINIDAKLDEEILKANGLSPVPFTGTDNYEGGRKAGQYAAENYQGAKTAILLGIEGHDATLSRTQGFLDAAGDAVEIVAQQNADFDVEKGYNAAQNIITANPGLQLIFTNSDGMGIGAARAVEEAGMLNQIDIISFDGISEALQLVLEGKIKVCVAQNAGIMGEIAADLAFKILNGQEVDLINDSGSLIIGIDEAENFMKEFEKYLY